MLLAQELETYRRELPHLLADHEGEFVLIHGETVHGFYATEKEGYEAGCRQFGLEPFLVRRVQETEELLRLLVDVDHPWLDSFGRSAADPDFEDYLREMERARQMDVVE